MEQLGEKERSFVIQRVMNFYNDKINTRVDQTISNEDKSFFYHVHRSRHTAVTTQLGCLINDHHVPWNRDFHAWTNSGISFATSHSDCFR